MNPIFVTGLPRSGTSLVTGILVLSGAWAGKTPPPDPYNRKGTFENIAIREGFLKPYLSILPADPLGLSPLPPVAMDPIIAPDLWRERIFDAILAEDYDGGPWVYKDAKLALCWRLWAESFPSARWIIVRRDVDDVVASCLRAEPMTRRRGFGIAAWERWANDYLQHLSSIDTDTIEIWPDRDILGDPAKMQPVIESLGLTWRAEFVSAFVDAKLWNRGDVVR